MRDDEKKLLQDTFSSVRAYLVYPQDLRASIEKLKQKSQDLQAFMDIFKRIVSDESDSSRKTDGQIFLNDLRKRLS